MGSVIFLVFCTIITFCHHASLRLGIPTCMVLCAEKDIWHKAISRRQQVMQEHESMARTAFPNERRARQFEGLCVAKISCD